MSHLLVSICVPTYNRAQELQRGLESILAQDYSPMEILIADNASEDETETIGRQIAKTDSRVRYIRHPTNLGLYGNHNFCIEASRGEYLCFFHDHDERNPKIVSTYVSFLKRHPEVGIVCSDWEAIDEKGHSLGKRRYRGRLVRPGLQYIDETMRSGRSSVAPAGAMIRRSALGKIRFDEDGPLGFGDFMVWFLIAEHFSIGHLPEVLWKLRQDKSAQSSRTIVSMAQDYGVNLSRYCDLHLKKWPEHGALVARWRRYIRRFLFWALAYEISLHYRRSNHGGSDSPLTIFEFLDYRLSPEEFEQTLKKLREYRTGLVEQAAFWMMEAFRRMRFTGPMSWATAHPTLFRNLLGLRE